MSPRPDWGTTTISAKPTPAITGPTNKRPPTSFVPSRSPAAAGDETGGFPGGHAPDELTHSHGPFRAGRSFCNLFAVTPIRLDYSL